MSSALPALRRLTKEDAVKLAPQISNLVLFMIPFRNRVLAIKKLLRHPSSKIYTYSNSIYTAITKLPKTTAGAPYYPIARFTKDNVDPLYRLLNQFQTLWQKYKARQTNELATQIAGVLIDIVDDFAGSYPYEYNRIYKYRNEYGISREDDHVDPATETLQNNIDAEPIINAPVAVTLPKPGDSLEVNSTVYPGIYKQKCVDPVLYETQPLDTTTSILYILDGRKVVRVYCLDADSIKGYLGDMSMVFYQCRPTVPIGAIMIRPESVFPTQIRRLPFDFAVYVYEKQIQQIKPGKKYVLIPSTVPVGRIASHTVITGGSVVSAQHCQNDYQTDFIYTVRELGDIPAPTEENLKKELAVEIAEEAAAVVAEKAEKVAAAKAKANSAASAASGGRRNRRQTRKRRLHKRQTRKRT